MEKKSENRFDKEGFEKIHPIKKNKLLLVIRRSPLVVLFLILFILSFYLPSIYIPYIATTTGILTFLAILLSCPFSPPENGRPISEVWYLVITTSNLLDSVSNLIENKETRGYKVLVKTVEDLQGFGTQPSKMRRWVLAAIRDNNIKKGYLLIVGDHHQIPGFPLQFEGKSFDSDSYYSMGEEDIVPFLPTGRLSSVYSDVISSICDLILQYPNSNNDWQKRIILTGILPRGIDARDTKEDCWVESLQEIGDCFEVKQLYENDYGVTHEPNGVLGNGPARRGYWNAHGDLDTLKSTIELGTLLLIYHGHGGDYEWFNIGIKNDTMDQKLHRNSINNYDVGIKTPIVISASCNTGDIEPIRSLAEAWQVNLKAIGFFGADITSKTWWNDRIIQRILHQIVSAGRDCIGDILVQAMLQLYDDYKDQGGNRKEWAKWMPRIYRYLGDPSTKIPLAQFECEPCEVIYREGMGLDVFTISPTGHLMHRHKLDEQGWFLWNDINERYTYNFSTLEGIGGLAQGYKPSAVYWKYNSNSRLDIFAKGNDSHLWHLLIDGYRYDKWEDLGRPLVRGLSSEPVAISCTENRLDVFATGDDYNLWHKKFTNSGGWDDWSDLGGSLDSKPVVCSWGDNRIDVFALGHYGTLKHIWFDGTWSDWEDLGGGSRFYPSVCSWGPGRLDIFVRGAGGRLKHLWFEGQWSDWEDLGGELASSPASCSWIEGRLDVFAQNRDRNLIHIRFKRHWRSWKEYSSCLFTEPTVISPREKVLVITARTQPLESAYILPRYYLPRRGVVTHFQLKYISIFNHYYTIFENL